jgi:hypothetical protein
VNDVASDLERITKPARTRKRRSYADPQPNSLCHQFPLRPDYLCQFVLPRDLTKAEAERIGAILLACVIPQPFDKGES